MAFHFIALLFSLNLVLMTGQAVIPPQVYWERMLPNTAMPKAIINLLNLDSKETNVQDEFYYTNGVKRTSSLDEIPFFYMYSTRKMQLRDGLPIISNYGTKIIKTEDEIPFFYMYGTKKTPSQQEIPFFYKYGSKKIRSQDEIPFFYMYATKDFHQSKNDANAHLPKMTPNIANHHQHGNSKVDLIFLEEGLRPGSELDAHFSKRKYETPLLPHHVAQSIPFSSEKMKEILEILSVKQKSEDAEIVKKAISYCEAPIMNGEEKHCATSLESMVDFITSKLGKNVHVISTESEEETKSKKFMVKDGVKMLAEDKVIACHPMNYPYVVFFCHEILNTTAHFMPLEGEDGARVKSVAVCHRDTSGWDPNHVAFQVLKMKPGTAPVCHIFPEGHLLWFAK